MEKFKCTQIKPPHLHTQDYVCISDLFQGKTCFGRKVKHTAALQSNKTHKYTRFFLPEMTWSNIVVDYTHARTISVVIILDAEDFGFDIGSLHKHTQEDSVTRCFSELM